MLRRLLLLVDSLKSDFIPCMENGKSFERTFNGYFAKRRKTKTFPPHLRVYE
jgi:hypothetical protein